MLQWGFARSEAVLVLDLSMGAASSVVAVSKGLPTSSMGRTLDWRRAVSHTGCSGLSEQSVATADAGADAAASKPKSTTSGRSHWLTDA